MTTTITSKMAVSKTSKTPTRIANSPCVKIHLDNILHNFEIAKSLAPQAKVMAVVKANAYGHGSLEVCQTLKEADAFAVARVSEAVYLRNEGIQNKLFILEGFLDQAELDICHSLDLIPFVHSEYQLKLLDEDLPVWLKVNTGMNRLGFSPANLKVNKQLIKQINIVGLASHFANSDQVSHEANQSQIDLFLKAKNYLGLDVELSFANSDCILFMPEQHLDWIRPGIMLYGSSTNTETDKRLRHGMTLSAPVIAINDLQAGDAMGYGGRWVADKKCRVAVVGLGYADGYPREMPDGTPVLVNGERRRLVGPISMDMLFVELCDEDEVKAGDHFVFWGEQLSIDEVAAFAQTIGYTLMTGLTPRVRREFIHTKSSQA